MQTHRQAVLDTLSRPETVLDEAGIRDTLLHFLRTGDLPMAGALLSRIVWRLAPWTDSDGRLTALWLASTLDSPGGQRDPRPALLSAFDLVETGLRLPSTGPGGPSDGLLAAARLLLRQAFPLVVEAADAGLMDRWLALPRIRRGLDFQPAPEQLEQAIAQVYLKRHNWPRIAQLLRQLERPSPALYHELFTSSLQASLLQRARPGVEPGVRAFEQLQGRLEMLRRAGIQLGGSAAVALEAVLLEHQAPPAFLHYIEGLGGGPEPSP